MIVFYVIAFLAIGTLAGAIAGKVVEGHQFGIWRDALIGVIGAFIGGWLLPTIGVFYGTWGLLAMATLGSVLLLVGERMLRFLIKPLKKNPV